LVQTPWDDAKSWLSVGDCEGWSERFAVAVARFVAVRVTGVVAVTDAGFVSVRVRVGSGDWEMLGDGRQLKSREYAVSRQPS
jgi:hypothetical protein